LALGLVVLLMTSRSAIKGQAAEACGCALLVIAGLMLVSISGELVLLFLGLELTRFRPTCCCIWAAAMPRRKSDDLVLLPQRAFVGGFAV
jgi:NADH:ubiquinone oxidoreductase subunit 2 (subunit N)